MGMARGTMVWVWCLLALGCSPSAERLDPAREEALREEVRETLSGLTQAMNSGDPDRIFRYYRGDEEFLFLGCTDVLLGWSAFSGRVATFYRANPEVSFQQEVVRIQILSPTVAVAALRGGSSDAEELFWTEVLVREGEGWKIAYEHESWPGCSPAPTPHPFTTPETMPGDTPTGGEDMAPDTTAPDTAAPDTTAGDAAPRSQRPR